MRCGDECSREVYLIPKEITDKERDRDTPILVKETELLVCPKCKAETRPHVLWFDEYYNEHHFYLHQVLKIAKQTGLLFVIGTSGATNLPKRIVENTLARQGIVIDINPNKNLFSNHLNRIKNGYTINGKSTEILPLIKELIKNTI